MVFRQHAWAYALLATLGATATHAQSVTLDPGFHHLRNASPREWSHFPESAASTARTIGFDLTQSSRFKLLTLRQADVKQSWTVSLNGQKLGGLDRDDNDLEHSLPIPPGLLRDSANSLHISTSSKTPDDIRIGEIAIHSCHKAGLPTGAKLSLTVTESGRPVPCRLTIVDAQTNKLVILGAGSTDNHAVRPGVIYSLDGRANITIRPGRYTIWAGRGFEYSLAETELTIAAGDSRSLQLSLTREVDTSGLVACDTHLHTNEFARHGDATLTERLITIAGEGIELPISTEHDQHIDYSREAERIGANNHFTPVIGCEVTTKLGHFNSFPILPGSAVAQHRLRPWPKIFDSIYSTPGVRIAVLNHPRDIHGGFRPFAPSIFDPSTGKFTDGRLLEANALEVINSGAQQSDPMRLVHDWMSLLKSGHKIAAVGSSDSHTVNFAIVGQARTYIPCPDNHPGNLDITAAVDSIVAANTHVSFGLLTKLRIENSNVTAEIHGPSWTTAEKITLFLDGSPVAEHQLTATQGRQPGLKIARSWPLKDLGKTTATSFLVAVATGPGISAPYWRMMPPYQAETPQYTPYVMGISPARWLATDGR